MLLSLGGWTSPHLTLPGFITDFGKPESPVVVDVIPAPATVRTPTLALLGGAAVTEIRPRPTSRS